MRLLTDTAVRKLIATNTLSSMVDDAAPEWLDEEEPPVEEDPPVGATLEGGALGVNTAVADARQELAAALTADEEDGA